MKTIFKKLQFKNQDKIYVRAAPPSFKPVLQEMAEFTTVKTSPNCKQHYEFALFFVKSKEDVKRFAPKAADKVQGDGILWFAYPKKSSKTFKTDMSRDDGWQPLGKWGFEPVRQVAIDDDWSALRFRRVEYITSMQRDSKRLLSDEAKTRIPL